PVRRPPPLTLFPYNDALPISLIGKLGVESAFERELHGTNGYREVLVNALGRSVERQGAFVPNLRTRSPAAGDDLLLAIDLKVQRDRKSTRLNSSHRTTSYGAL